MLSTVPVECPPGLLKKAVAVGATRAVVVNAGSRSAMEGAQQATEHGIIQPVLVGDRARINEISEEICWDISDVVIEPTRDEVEAASVAVDMARQGSVDALMKGNVRTNTLIRAVLNRENGLRTGSHLSHVFHMTLPGSDDALCITDAVINILPTVDQQIDIATNAIRFMQALGVGQPKIALLSATDAQSAAMPSSVNAAILRDAFADDQNVEATVDGPMAFDLAVSGNAARIKGFESPVAGEVDVLLVPNIETGNALFKMMVYFMSAAAAGLVLGAKVPIMLTSRADPAAARLASAALAAIYSRFKSAPDS